MCRSESSEIVVHDQPSFEMPEKAPEECEMKTLESHIKECLKRNYTMEDLPKLTQAINSEDRFRQHLGVIGVRMLISVGNLKK